MVFTGLSAFPLTPVTRDAVDLGAYRRLVARLVDAGVDSIGALGSTGSYAYLSRAERREVTAATLECADGVPVIVGTGALRTGHVQALTEDAQSAGAAAVMVAPVSYQPLTEDDVYSLYEDVVAGLSVPLVVYDNPGTTGFTFSLDLYAGVTRLPHVAAIKIPPVGDLVAARARIQAIRAVVPAHIHIGVSGDGTAAAGLLAGGDAWYSALGGTIPHAILKVARFARGRDERAEAESARLRPLWDLLATHGSARVAAAIAEHLNLVTAPCLPRPLLGLSSAEHEQVGHVVDELNLS